MRFDKERYRRASYQERAILLLEQQQYLREQQHDIDEQRKRLDAYRKRMRRWHDQLSGEPSAFDRYDG